MERLCKFAVLRYVPNETRQEFINVGLVFHCPEESFIDMRITSNFSRLTTFDDEIDVDLIKLILSGVKTEFSQDIEVGRPSSIDLTDWNYIDKATAIYANQLQFSPIYTIRSADIISDYEDLFRTYVYFDSHKSHRITSDRVKTIMNRVLREKNVLIKMQKDVSFTIGSEEVKLDYYYTVNDKPRFIKTFSFDYTDQGSKKAPATAKEWYFNFSKLARLGADKVSLPNNPNRDLEIITLVYVEKTNKNIDIALDILRESTKELVTAQSSEAIERFADKITLELVN